MPKRVTFVDNALHSYNAALERAPAALCIQLKRFSGINGKISKHINISLDLDFSQYSSKDTRNSQLKYRLVSMITHLGSTPHSGHYTAIGCCQDGSYHQFDDSAVRAMSTNGLMNTNPYIIFYELVPAKSSTTIASLAHHENSSKRTETSTQFIGPMLPVPNQLIKPIQSPLNGCVLKQYGATSNGFTDSRKLGPISNNQMKSLKKSTTDTTATASSSISKLTTIGGHSSNETLTKNVDNSSTKVSGTSSSSSPSSTVNTSSIPIQESPAAKRIVEPANKLPNETATKISEDSRNSSDSESEIPSPPRVVTLPSMPELKSHSPATLKNGDITRPSNGMHQSADGGDSHAKRSSDNERETVTTNSLQRKSHSPSSSLHKGTVAVYCSPAKPRSPINQKNEENRKLVSISYRESMESENKLQSPSLPPIRQSVNPFSRVSNIPVKIGKHKTNGYSQQGTYNQRNSKPTNGYMVSPRKSLVPYACHDDSDSNNEDRKSPPMVKTKAGPFQVTKNTTTNGNSRNTSDTRLPWSKSSNGGRVPSLNTWNGGTSILQDEIVNEQRENNKRKSETVCVCVCE